jgi:hypothetical protein
VTFSLYDAIVPSFQRMLGSVSGLLNKAEKDCAEHGVAPEAVIGARLVEDMLPFAYQVKSTAVHSAGAIAGAKAGSFSPDQSEPGASFAALGERIGQARAALDALSEDDVNDLLGRPMRFVFGKHYADFTAETFLLTFSKPNFYFHATTAYDILRSRGLAIGKVDFIGQLEFKRIE